MNIIKVCTQCGYYYDDIIYEPDISGIISCPYCLTGIIKIRSIYLTEYSVMLDFKKIIELYNYFTSYIPKNFDYSNDDYFVNSDSKDGIIRYNNFSLESILYRFQICPYSYSNRIRDQKKFLNKPEDNIYNFSPEIEGKTRLDELLIGCKKCIDLIIDEIKEPTICGEEKIVELEEYNDKINKFNKLKDFYNKQYVEK